jgi:gliding motility-associated-like protein
VVATLTGGDAVGALQIGPDQKIYIAQFNRRFLSLINQPNTAGINCNVQYSGVLLSRQCQLGLPALAATKEHRYGISASNSCFKQFSQFRYSSPLFASSRLWNFGDPASGTGNTSISLQPSHVFTAPGTYQVQVKLTLPGPDTILYTQVTVHPPALLPLLPAYALCPESALQLDATTPGARNYRWSTGDTTAVITVTAPGQYRVRASSAFGCQGFDTTTVTLAEAPRLLGNDTTYCSETPFRLKALVPLDNYLWSTGETSSEITVSTPASYFLQTVYQGCLFRESIVLSAASCTPLLPNIITPNGDALNDYFAPEGFLYTTLQLQVFNRWGQLIYEEKDYKGNWQGASQPDGVYYYVLRESKNSQVFKGFVEIIR